MAKPPSHSTISSDQGLGWFGPLVIAILVIGVGSVAFLATNRESNLGVSPEVGQHWHNAYGVYNCGQFLPPIDIETQSGGGIHTHGDGLIHIHPFNAAASGNGATIETFFESTQESLTDSRYQSSPFAPQQVTLDEAAGCAGEPAELVLAYWEDVNTPGDGPEIIRENLADVKFDKDFAGFTIALIPEATEASEIPLPPSWTGLAVVSPDLGGAEIEVPTITVPGEEDGSTDSQAPASEDESSTTTEG